MSHTCSRVGLSRENHFSPSNENDKGYDNRLTSMNAFCLSRCPLDWMACRPAGEKPDTSSKLVCRHQLQIDYGCDDCARAPNSKEKQDVEGSDGSESLTVMKGEERNRC